MVSLSEQLQKLSEEPLDLRTLPYDSSRAAQLWMIHDYNKGRGYHPVDCLIVLGDPTEGVSPVQNPEELLQYFERRRKQRQEFLDKIRPLLQQRHQQFLREMGVYSN